MSFLDSDEPRQGELLPSAIKDEIKPFAGFLPRFFAFLIDGLALYAAGGLIFRLLNGAMLDLNPWLPYWGIAAGFLYFWLSAGPVGQGRTLGMAVLGLHIVGRDGQMVGWRPALARTAIQYLAVYGMLNLVVSDWFYYLLAWPVEFHYAGLVTLTLLGLGSLTLSITLALTMAMHPYKRGWHDQWAGTYVTRDPTPAVFAETLATPPDVLTERKLANHLRMTFPFWLISMVVLGYGALQPLTRGDVRAQMADVAALNLGSLAGSDQTAVFLSYPSTDAVKMFKEEVQRERAFRAQRHENVPTTETLRTQWGDGETIFLRLYQRRGAFRESEIGSVRFKNRMADLRRQVWPLWHAYRARWEKETKTPTPSANRIIIVIYEHAQFLLYGQGRVVVGVRGPADPSAGPLASEIIPQAGDRATTSTAASTVTGSKAAR